MRLALIIFVAAIAGVLITAMSSMGLHAAVTGMISAVIVAIALFAAVPSARARGISAERTRSETARLPIGFGRALLEVIPQPLLVISDKGRIGFANRAAFAMVDHIRSGDHFANVIRVPVFVEAVNSVLANGQERDVSFEIPGQDRRYKALVSPLPKGTDLGDEAQVLIRIEDRTQAIRDQQARTDFIANASHELRTPLASLLGYIETLRGHARDDEAAKERFMGIMAKQAERMQRLVDDLMSLSRIERDEHIPPQDDVDAIEVFAEAVTTLSPIAEKVGTTMDNRASGMSAPVKGDRDQLLQVAVNVIENAIKYGKAGGLVVVTANIRDGEVGITVADDGPGIERRHIARLTERFYRANTSTSREVGGTGLGLAIVKHILRRHRGRLDVASTPSRGSSFTIWLPLAADSVDNIGPTAGVENNI